MKGIRKGYLLGQNGIQKGKGLDLTTEPSRIELCRKLPPGFTSKLDFSAL